MTMRVTMRSHRRSEDGFSVLLVGTTYTVSDDFGQALVQAGHAVDTDNVIAAEDAAARDDLLPAEVRATRALVSEYEIPADEYTDAVTLTATGVVHGMPGRLHAVTVLSGTCDLALADGAGAGTSGIRTIATYAGLTAGELIPFPGDGLPFVNALLATITGTATLRFEVI